MAAWGACCATCSRIAFRSAWADCVQVNFIMCFWWNFVRCVHAKHVLLLLLPHLRLDGQLVLSSVLVELAGETKHHRLQLHAPCSQTHAYSRARAERWCDRVLWPHGQIRFLISRRAEK